MADQKRCERRFLAEIEPGHRHFSPLRAALALSQAAEPGRLPSQVLLPLLQGLPALDERLAGMGKPYQKFEALSSYFFGELGFSGNDDAFDDPRHSDLAQVLARRRGIPITLALLYVELATQAGLKASGISFPGHFLVKLRLPQGEVVIDPFSGQSLSRAQLEQRLVPVRRALGLQGDEEIPLGLYLQSATPRGILERMLRNLEAIHRACGDRRALLQQPDATHEHRAQASELVAKAKELYGIETTREVVDFLNGL